MDRRDGMYQQRFHQGLVRIFCGLLLSKFAQPSEHIGLQRLPLRAFADLAANFAGLLASVWMLK